MAHVIRFDPSRPPGGQGNQRFPRFDEVGTHIDAQANRLFDADASLAQCSGQYARLEARLKPEDRGLLREFYEAITAHHEHFEHAAYLVGLQAGAGRLAGLPLLADDRLPPDEPQPA